jgi:xylan 1,4-beta-xylosidase
VLIRSVNAILLAVAMFASSVAGATKRDHRENRGFDSSEVARTWMADNGNGTYTNPLFYDEFSDPDIIRVRDDYYVTGTTMCTMRPCRVTVPFPL